MFSKAAVAALPVVLCVSLWAQEKKAAGTKSVMHDLTVTTSESVYTGTMDLAIDMGKVTGKMVVTSPTAITGNVAGTSKAGEVNLEFPFHMVEQNCDGTVKMSIKLPEKAGPSTGTMEAVGCGGDKIGGTVELEPSAAKPGGRGGEAGTAVEVGSDPGLTPRRAARPETVGSEAGRSRG
jgi:hypothetical protein